MLARSADKLRELEAAIPGARGFAADVSDAASVTEAFNSVRRGYADDQKHYGCSAHQKARHVCLQVRQKRARFESGVLQRREKSFSANI